MVNAWLVKTRKALSRSQGLQSPRDLWRALPCMGMTVRGLACIHSQALFFRSLHETMCTVVQSTRNPDHILTRLLFIYRHCPGFQMTLECWGWWGVEPSGARSIGWWGGGGEDWLTWLGLICFLAPLPSFSSANVILLTVAPHHHSISFTS